VKPIQHAMMQKKLPSYFARCLTHKTSTNN
jgi:hypothetical protein